MMKVFCFITIVLYATLLQAGERMALVIGNGNYSNNGLSYLPNPTKDAKLIKDTLEQLGFKVIFKENLDKERMDSAIEAFTQQLDGTEIAFFYYAGHGSAYAGQNYLLPIKAKISSATQLRYRANDAQEILGMMSEKAKNSIFILDACRDTPFTKSSGFRGLAPIIGASNKSTYVIYAADKGQKALDNRAFAIALSNSLLKPQSIRQAAVETRNQVLISSKNEQFPVVFDKLIGEVYLKGKPTSPKKNNKPTISSNSQLTYVELKRIRSELHQLGCLDVIQDTKKWNWQDKIAINRLVNKNKEILDGISKKPGKHWVGILSEDYIQACKQVEVVVTAKPQQQKFKPMITTSTKDQITNEPETNVIANTKIEKNSKKSKHQQEVSSLKKQIIQAINSNRLTTSSKGKSALSLINELEKLEPNSEFTKSQRNEMVQKYASWASSSITRGNLRKARSYLTKIKIISGNSSEIDKLSKKISAKEQAQRIAAEKRRALEVKRAQEQKALQKQKEKKASEKKRALAERKKQEVKTTSVSQSTRATAKTPSREDIISENKSLYNQKCTDKDLSDYWKRRCGIMYNSGYTRSQ